MLLSSSPLTFGPDPTFGSDGVVTNTAAASGDAVVALANGDTVVAETLPNATYGDQVVLQRYRTNGTIDPTFGIAGSVTVANSSSIAGLVKDNRGRLLVLLQSIPNVDSASQDFYTSIARLKPNGTLDKSFGSEGFASISTPNIDVSQSTFVVDDQSRVLLFWNNGDDEIERFTANGQPDPAFGDHGLVGVDYFAYSLGFQPDGKVLVGASLSNGTVQNEPAVIRYNARGILDRSFGADGTAISTVPLPPTSTGPGIGGTVGCITLLSGGRIAIAGEENDEEGIRPPPDEKLYVAEFSAGGVPVKGFGSDGASVTVIDPATPAGNKQITPSLITPLSDGSLIVAGNYFAQQGMGAENDMTVTNVEVMVVRYTPQGLMDNTFGNCGLALVTVPGDSSTVGISTTAPSFADGKITVAWDTGVGNAAGFDLLRYDLAPASSVSGTVFNDLNGDGVHQKKEAGLSGVFVYEDLTNAGYYVAGDPSTTTSANGTFKLIGLAPGDDLIRTEPASGFAQTRPSANAGVEVSLFGGKVISGLLFAETEIA